MIAVVFGLVAGLAVQAQTDPEENTALNHPLNGDSIVRVTMSGLNSLGRYVKKVAKDKSFPCKPQLESYLQNVTGGGGSTVTVLRQVIAADSVFLKDKACKNCPSICGLIKNVDSSLRVSATLEGNLASPIASGFKKMRDSALAAMRRLASPDTAGKEKTAKAAVVPASTPIVPATEVGRTDSPAPTKPEKTKPETQKAEPQNPISWQTILGEALVLLLFSIATLVGVALMLRRQRRVVGVVPASAASPAPAGPPVPAASSPEPVTPSLSVVPIPVVPPLPVVPPAPAALPGRRMVCEVLMAAGPRKDLSGKEKDTSLGEDVCGLVTGPEEAVTWVLDGTSDSRILRNPDNDREYFSCRLLAQSLARQLKACFAAPGEDGLRELVQRAAAAVRAEWIRTLESLPAAEQQLLLDMVQEGRWPVCSTAVLIARLSLDGRLRAYRCGDSKLLVFAERDHQLVHAGTALSGKHPFVNDRLYFKIITNEAGVLDIWYSDPENEQISEDDVRVLIGFSDGIGDLSVALMKQRYAQAPDKVREELAYQLQGTGDDKSLCILEIIG